MKKYVIGRRHGTIHDESCPRLVLCKDATPIDRLYAVGETIVFPSEMRTIDKRAYTRKRKNSISHEVRAVRVTFKIPHKTTVRKHCADCILKAPEIAVPIGKRICYGPLHPEGKLISVKEFRRNGGYLSRKCRDCQGFIDHGGGIHHGYVPIEKVLPHLDVVVAAHGKMGAAKALGIHHDSIRKAYSEYKNVRKVTACRILEEAYRLKKAA